MGAGLMEKSQWVPDYFGNQFHISLFYNMYLVIFFNCSFLQFCWMDCFGD